MPIANLATEAIYYEVMGSGEPLVCVGGFTADHTLWDSIVPILKEHYQLILLDNPGCGQSSVPNRDYTIKDFSSTVMTLCDHLDIEKAYFLGNSMGGAIVQQIAYSYPGRVKKAVISNSFMNANELAFSLFAKARESWFDLGLSQEVVTHAMLSWCFSGVFLSKENIQLITDLNLNNPYPQTKEGYCFQFKALVNFDSSSWIRKIKTLCLFIASDEDAISFPSQILKMSKHVKGSQYLLFEGAGHLPHIEKPKLYSDKVIEFLEF
jgi:3-oxoadipate enol-lactonase